MSLKNFFFEESDESQKTPSQPANVTRLNVEQVQPLSFSSVASSVQASKSPGDFEKFKSHFDQIFDQANLPGPDYYEFAKMVESMGDAIPLDARILGAFQGLKHQGLTKDKLLATANEYLKVLDADSVNFTKKVNDEIESKRKFSTDTISTIKQKTDAIEQLKKEIEQHQASLNEYAMVESKMNEKTATYQSALEQMKSKINNDIARIKIIN